MIRARTTIKGMSRLRRSLRRSRLGIPKDLARSGDVLIPDRLAVDARAAPLDVERRGGRSTYPEWEGWAVLGALAGSLARWCGGCTQAASARPIAAPGRSRLSPRAQRYPGRIHRREWGAVHHRSAVGRALAPMYGGFADDFLWPPHLMIYGSLGLNSVRRSWPDARGPRLGGIRERFRANPRRLAGPTSRPFSWLRFPPTSFWHKIIGPDISAWSLPHFLLMLSSSSAVLLIGVALILSSGAPRSWIRAGRPRPSDVARPWFWLSPARWPSLEFGMPNGNGAPRSISPWVARSGCIPVVVVAIGAFEAHLVLHGLRRIGAATAAAMVTVAFSGCSSISLESPYHWANSSRRICCSSCRRSPWTDGTPGGFAKPPVSRRSSSAR